MVRYHDVISEAEQRVKEDSWGRDRKAAYARALPIALKQAAVMNGDSPPGWQWVQCSNCRSWRLITQVNELLRKPKTCLCPKIRQKLENL